MKKLKSYNTFQKTFKFGDAIVPINPNIHSSLGKKHCFLTLNDSYTDDFMFGINLKFFLLHPPLSTNFFLK